jgi:spore germination cell wall hydrolase CwlJ-like protein
MTDDSILDVIPEARVAALTVWGEARGEGLTGMAAVACVIRNRAVHPRVRWWGVGFRGVCLHPWQFSVWNQGDPNRRLLLSIAQGSTPPAAAPWIIAQAVANDVIDGKLPDITGGADHYHTTAVSPRWAQGQTPIKTIGNHIFYRLH